MFNNNKDFYPTPLTLINKMIQSVDFNQVKTILEPSAGKGDILEILEQKKKYYKHLDIDCIELDSSLQLILKGKNYRLIHDDFLTFDSMKQYDLILANFPFSDGEKHLLKALEMQERNGGALVCIINAETLKNDYTNVRKDINRKLKEYNATIEFIQDAFIDAERKTGVEIALIKVILPKVNKESFILNSLKRAQKQREYTESEQTAVVENDFFKAIVNQYNLEVKAGVNLIKEYYAMSPFILSEFTKDGQKGTPILKLDLSRNTNSCKNELSINSYIEEIRRKYWKALFHNEKFIGQLTENLRYEFYNKVDQLKDYDFTLYNIYELKLQMSKSVSKGIEETILKLFEELSYKHHWHDETSSNIHYYNGWKTNQSWIINKKVIIPLNAYGWSGYRPTDYKVLDKLTDIEKCFNYLDGGLTEALDIRDQLKFAEGYGETKKIPLKYFMVTFYQKGTCHIEFTNLELLKKFNIFGSQRKGWLPPSYGKAEYRSMTPEEKAVINEFEGQEEYKKTLTNKNYYIFNGNSVMMLEDKTA
jgi:hypothetical protein